MEGKWQTPFESAYERVPDFVGVQPACFVDRVTAATFLVAEVGCLDHRLNLCCYALSVVRTAQEHMQLPCGVLLFFDQLAGFPTQAFSYRRCKGILTIPFACQRLPGLAGGLSEQALHLAVRPSEMQRFRDGNLYFRVAVRQGDVGGSFNPLNAAVHHQFRQHMRTVFWWQPCNAFGRVVT